MAQLTLDQVPLTNPIPLRAFPPTVHIARSRHLESVRRSVPSPIIRVMVHGWFAEAFLPISMSWFLSRFAEAFLLHRHVVFCVRSFDFRPFASS